MRNVRDDEQALVPSLLKKVELCVGLLDLRRAVAVGLLNFRGVLPLPLRSGDLVSRGVLLALQPFDLGQQPAATGLEGRKLLELARQVDAAIGNCGLDGGDVVSEKGGIDHVCALAFTSYNSARLADARRAKAR